MSHGGYVMGTVLELTLHLGNAERGAGLARELLEEAASLEALLSRHDPRSALSRINERAGQGVVASPASVVELAALARDAALRTRGAFDPTVGPLVALWSEAARRDRVPSPLQLASARSRVGPQRLRIEAGGIALDPGSSLDLGGIAKGYALDRLASRLEREPVVAALLSFGQSSVWAVGAPPGRAGWRLLVRGPDGGFAGVITLRDRALSVSESQSQSHRIEGRVFGHVIDPRSGWPATSRRQALVIAPDATRAEVLSTALLVLGAEEGIALVEQSPGCEALLQNAAGGRWASRGFAHSSGFEPLPPRMPHDA